MNKSVKIIAGLLTAGITITIIALIYDLINKLKFDIDKFKTVTDNLNNADQLVQALAAISDDNPDNIAQVPINIKVNNENSFDIPIRDLQAEFGYTDKDGNYHLLAKTSDTEENKKIVIPKNIKDHIIPYTLDLYLNLNTLKLIAAARREPVKIEYKVKGKPFWWPWNIGWPLFGKETFDWKL